MIEYPVRGLNDFPYVCQKIKCDKEGLPERIENCDVAVDGSNSGIVAILL